MTPTTPGRASTTTSSWRSRWPAGIAITSATTTTTRSPTSRRRLPGWDGRPTDILTVCPRSLRVAAITLERAELDAVDAVLEVVRNMRERERAVATVDGDLDRRAVGDQRADDGFVKVGFD